MRDRPETPLLGCSGILWDIHSVPHGVVTVGNHYVGGTLFLLLLGAGRAVSGQAVIILRTDFSSSEGCRGRRAKVHFSTF